MTAKQLRKYWTSPGFNSQINVLITLPHCSSKIHWCTFSCKLKDTSCREEYIQYNIYINYKHRQNNTVSLNKWVVKILKVYGSSCNQIQTTTCLQREQKWPGSGKQGPKLVSVVHTWWLPYFSLHICGATSPHPVHFLKHGALHTLCVTIPFSKMKMKVASYSANID